MNRIIVFDYCHGKSVPTCQDTLFIPRVHQFEDIRPAYEAVSRNVFCIWLDNTLLSLSDIPFDESFEGIPIVLHLYNVGSIYVTLSRLDILKRLGIRVFLSSSSRENFSSLKILSSLGIDCGLLIDSERVDDEAFVDLASYYYLSQVPHATIEPFDYIWRNLHQEKNLDFSTVYFENPEKYIYVNEALDAAFSEEDLLKGSFIGNLNEMEKVDFQTMVSKKMTSYYSHFLQLDDCSKCPNFKICNKKMKTAFENCSEVFASVYEYAEIMDSIEQQRGKTKELCQL